MKKSAVRTLPERRRRRAAVAQIRQTRVSPEGVPAFQAATTGATPVARSISRVPGSPGLKTCRRQLGRQAARVDLRAQIFCRVAQSVERRPVNALVGGSIPSPTASFPSVAQPGSAAALGAEGRKFESCHSDHTLGRELESDAGGRLALQRGSASSTNTALWSSPVARQAHNLKVVGSNPTGAST